MSDLINKLADEARRVEEDTEHSFKGHYNAAARWGCYHLCIGLPAALSAASAGAAAFRDQPEWAGALALVSTALTTVLTFLKPSERAEMHKAVAGQYSFLGLLASRQLAQYFFEAVDSLEAGWYSPQWKQDAVRRLKELASHAQSKERSGQPGVAEITLRRLLPPVGRAVRV
jgi:hypothetical protein